MTNEQILFEMVRARVRQEFPAQSAVGDRAAWVAKASYTEGATIAESCDRAHAFVRSWMHHPAHSDARDRGLLRLVG
jgi:hypothetical protein